MNLGLWGVLRAPDLRAGMQPSSPLCLFSAESWLMVSAARVEVRPAHSVPSTLSQTNLPAILPYSESTSQICHWSLHLPLSPRDA